MSYAPGPSFLGIKVIDLSDDTQVNSGGNTNTQTLQPPTGQIYKVVGISLNTPAIGGASGTHKTEFNYDSFIFPEGRLQGTDGANYYIAYNVFTANSELPANSSDQLNFINKILWATNDEPLKITYTNSSDANQTGTRTLVFMVAIYKELI